MSNTHSTIQDQTMHLSAGCRYRVTVADARTTVIIVTARGTDAATVRFAPDAVVRFLDRGEDAIVIDPAMGFGDEAFTVGQRSDGRWDIVEPWYGGQASQLTCEAEQLMRDAEHSGMIVCD